jgi:hypothetical protein
MKTKNTFVRRELEENRRGHIYRVREAWKTAALKHGEEYADAIFPTGNPRNPVRVPVFEGVRTFIG